LAEAARFEERSKSRLLFALYLLAVFVRSPTIVIHGRFWAEEGTVYFQYALTHAVHEAIFAAQLGYYSLVPNLGAALAAHILPLESAPLAMTALALLVQCLPVCLILWGSLFTSVEQRGLALLVVLFGGVSQEVWLNTINSQFHLALTCGLILVSQSRSKGEQLFHRALLLLAGLTGPVSVQLTPLFVARALLERSGKRLVQAAILGGCSLLQISIISSSLENSASRSFGFGPVIFAQATVVKGFLNPFIGASQLGDVETFLEGAAFGEWSLILGVFVLLLLLVLILLQLTFLVRVWLLSRSDSRWLMVSAAFVWVASFAGALGDKSSYVSTISGGRYFFAPLSLGLLAVVYARRAPRVRLLDRSVITIALLWITAIGINEYWRYSWALGGPSWKSEIRAWKNDPSRLVAIWPSGWSVTIPPE
jgi:hypothetical protein